eukprot:scaffold88_cov105-Skeletonema_dohrnii-CCMP3373.AAC.2
MEMKRTRHGRLKKCRRNKNNCSDCKVIAYDALLEESNKNRRRLIYKGMEMRDCVMVYVASKCTYAGSVAYLVKILPHADRSRQCISCSYFEFTSSHAQPLSLSTSLTFDTLKEEYNMMQMRLIHRGKKLRACVKLKCGEGEDVECGVGVGASRR